MRFEVDPRRVVHETIENEAILIHLETGFYYSLEGSGAEIWNSLVGGSSSGEIACALRARYDAPPAVIEDAVSGLVGELAREQLLRQAREGSARGGSVDATATANGDASARTRFEAPMLHRYTDMADFMLVDPIHEVDESGWPNRKPAA